MPDISTINNLNDVAGGRANYIQYDFTNVKVSIGLPPVPLKGLDYVTARLDNPPTSRIMSLTGAGIFVNNQNTSGTIEIACQGSSAASSTIELMNLTGIPYPISLIDTGTTAGMGQVIGTACRRVGTPDWRRSKFPDLDLFTFQCVRLFISNGLRRQH